MIVIIIASSLSGCVGGSKSLQVEVPDTGLTYMENSHHMGYYASLGEEQLAKISAYEDELPAMVDQVKANGDRSIVYGWMVKTRQDYDDQFALMNLTILYSHNAKKNFDPGSDNWKQYDVLESAIKQELSTRFDSYNGGIISFDSLYGDKYGKVKPLVLNISGYMQRANIASAKCDGHYNEYKALSKPEEMKAWFNATKEDYDEFFMCSDTATLDIYYYQQGVQASDDNPSYKTINTTDMRKSLNDKMMNYNDLITEFNSKYGDKYGSIDYV
jgi:hypothetical protein